jgi:hypothetical protein
VFREKPLKRSVCPRSLKNRPSRKKVAKKEFMTLQCIGSFLIDRENNRMYTRPSGRRLLADEPVTPPELAGQTPVKSCPAAQEWHRVSR